MPKKPKAKPAKAKKKTPKRDFAQSAHAVFIQSLQGFDTKTVRFPREN